MLSEYFQALITPTRVSSTGQALTLPRQGLGNLTLQRYLLSRHSGPSPRWKPGRNPVTAV